MGGGLAEKGGGEKREGGEVSELYHIRHRERTRSDPVEGDGISASGPSHAFKHRQLDCFAIARKDGRR